MEQREWIEFLIARYSQPLVSYVGSILKDKESAKDIVQQSFLALLDQNRKNVEKNVKGWLFRDCRNRAIDMWRKKRGADPYAEDIEQMLKFADADPFVEFELQSEALHLRTQIAKLPPRHQEALWLKFKDKLSYKEIAQVLGISPPTVAQILFESVVELREAAGRIRHLPPPPKDPNVQS